MQLTDSIVAEFKRGQLDNFYRVAYPALLTYAVRLLTDGCAFLAEDCVQDCILKSYNERERITDAQSWKSYLYTSVHNACANLLRHHRVHDSYVSQLLSEEVQQAHAIEQEVFDELYRAIDELPQKYRTIFELSFEQGLAIPDIADRLSLSVSGVKKQKSKMIGLLRDKMPKDVLNVVIF